MKITATSLPGICQISTLKMLLDWEYLESFNLIRVQAYIWTGWILIKDIVIQAFKCCGLLFHNYNFFLRNREENGIHFSCQQLTRMQSPGILLLLIIGCGIIYNLGTFYASKSCLDFLGTYVLLAGKGKWQELFLLSDELTS